MLRKNRFFEERQAFIFAGKRGPSSMIDDSSIKHTIYFRRRMLGISQDEMASRLGIDRNTYGNLETGKTRIINRHMHAIAEQLGSSLEELLLGYQPVDPETIMHEGDLTYDAKIQTLITGYETQLEADALRIEQQRKRIVELEAALQDKTDLITFQKEKLAEYQKNGEKR